MFGYVVFLTSHFSQLHLEFKFRLLLFLMGILLAKLHQAVTRQGIGIIRIRIVGRT